MARRITWLHLSDLHARTRDGWDSQQITSSLVRDLKTMQKDHGLRPDFIFFTGDLAYGAVNGENMDDQYQLVRNFLDAVRKAFDPEIPIRDLYLVPGNHDVDRDEILPEQTEWLRHHDRKLGDIISAMRDGKKQWRTWMDRLQNYRRFLTSYGLQHLAPDDPHLIWADARQIHGIRVGVTGLNSAWSCAGNEDKAKLWFGTDWQITQAKQLMGQVDFAFVLLHHPGNWFTAHEDPALMRRLRQEFEIVLHGHEHQEWVEANSEGHLVLSAGACYESSWMANGYNFGYIDLDQREGGVRLRQWDYIGRGWVQQNIANKTANGLWSLQNLAWLDSSNNEKTDSSAEAISSTDDSLTRTDDSAEENFTHRYCNHVVKQHDVLELFGCDIPRELQSHQLSVAYVSLNLAPEDSDETLTSVPCSQTPSKKLAESKDDEVSQEIIEDTSAAIDRVLDKVSAGTGRLLINGPAGAGKSTLLRWCAIYAAQQMLNTPSGSAQAFAISNTPKSLSNANHLNNVWQGISGAWRQKIPFLIRLRDCPAGRLPAAKELPGFLAKHLPSAPSNWMTNVLDSGQALVLFDGVDEIHQDQRSQLADEIGELIRTYPDCIYVVTTRPGAVEPGWLARLNFTEARVEPMGRQDREEFIDKWYRSAALELKKRPRPGEDLTKTASRLKVELAEQPELGLLATNPLLCAMICALYRERQEKLPETPAELSEALCHMLLHRREREMPGLDGKHFLSSWRDLQYSQKKGLLAELAWHMVSHGDSSIECADAKLIVAEGLASTPGRTKEEADEVVQALVERSGLLRPASDDRIDFLHNVLKEYLAAGRAVETGDWKILAERADDPAWQPVILFALALAPEPFSSGLVTDLLAHTGSPKSTWKKTSTLTKKERETLAIGKARQFFLVRCRAAAKCLAANLSITIDEFFRYLLPPTSMNDVEALAQLGPKILNYGTKTIENGDWWARQNGQMATRCLRLLRMVGGPRAKAVLKTISYIPSLSSQLHREWILACCELSPEERLEWPFLVTEWLDLSSLGIADISFLEDLTKLRFLYLSNTRVTSLNPLIGLTTLQELILSRTPVIDLSPLAGLTSLKNLILSAAPVSNLGPLASLNSLERLNCSYSKVHDLSPLVRLSTLKILTLDMTPIVDLGPLQGLKSLQRLSLSGTKVTDFSPLAGLISLQYLDLEDTQIDDLWSLQEMTSLKSLDLTRTEIEDFSILAKLTSLEYLDLTGTKITNLNPLAALFALKRLYLRDARINDLTPLAGLASLEWLHLNQVNVTELSQLIGIKSLTYLYLGKTGIRSQELEDFKMMRPDVKIQ